MKEKVLYNVTVITATWNAMPLLARCAESVSCQRLPQGCTLEHLVVDGCSTDGTVEFLKKWCIEAENRRYISERDSGLYDAMNKGARLAFGEIIVFLNADDQFVDELSVARSIAPILAGESDFVCAPAIVKKTDGSYSHTQWPDLTLPYLSHPFNTQTLFMKRSDFMQLGGHDLSYKVAGDTDLDCKLFQAGLKGYALEEPTIVAQDGGFGVTHYYAHERARILHAYQDDIHKRCARNSQYAYEYFLSLMRVSKVHPANSKLEKRNEAGRLLLLLHRQGRTYWPICCRVLSKLTEKMVLIPIQKGASVEKRSWKNVLLSFGLRCCMLFSPAKKGGEE